MARSDPTPARVQRLTSLVATTLIAVAIGLAFGRVFQGHRTTVLLLAAGLVSGALAWVFERRGVALASTVSVALLVVGLGALLFSKTTWYGLPTLSTLKAMGSAAGAVGTQARILVSPAPPVRPLVFASTIGIWAAVFSCHALAFRASSPVLALLPPLALVAFADSVLEEQTRPFFGTLFLVAGLAVLFADALRRVQGWGPVWSGPGRRDRLLPTAGTQARRLAAGVVTLALAAPLFVPGFGARAVIDLSAVNGDRSTSLSTLVSMASKLTQGARIELFQVDTPVPTYYRLQALDRFDGVSWTSTPEATTPVTSGQSLGALPPEGMEVTQSFRMLNDLGSDLVPVASQPITIEISGATVWAAGSGTLTRAQDPLRAGDTYRVTSAYPRPTPDELRGAPVVDSAALLQLPAGMPPQIHALALTWTQDATTAYDAAMAIQTHLRDFIYNPSVHYGEDMSSMVRFLSNRRGFCQQFATTMAVMLRGLGIPARVAVGFTQGQSADGASNTYVISTKELHVWVEVPFQGLGFVPFEPTPTRTNPAMSSYVSPIGATNCQGSHCSGQTPTGTDGVQITHAHKVGNGPEVGRTTEPAGAQAAGRRRDLRGGLLLAIALLMVVALLRPALPAWRRRRTLRRAGRAPRRLILASYDVFTQRAALAGMPRRTGETPEEYRRRLVASGRLTDEDLGRLTRLTVRAAYARDEPTDGDASDAVADADAAGKMLQRSVPLRMRALAAYRPR